MNFKPLASESYYRSLLDPTFEKLKEKLKDKIKSDNPATNAISLDGWSENHEGIDSIQTFHSILCRQIEHTQIEASMLFQMTTVISVISKSTRNLWR